jgi:hypothetical protein
MKAVKVQTMTLRNLITGEKIQYSTLVVQLFLERLVAGIENRREEKY